MSKEQTKVVLTNFVKNSNPEVVALKWEWWVWKTFFWKEEFLKEIKDEPDLKFKTYSYVSLFWVWSIDELRQLIYHNQINVEEIWCDIVFEFDKIKDPENLENIKTVSKSKLLSASSWSRFFSGTSKVIDQMIPDWLWGEVVKKYNPVKILVWIFSFLKTKDCLICIDDFERTTLSKKDILWVVSELKEQRKCKVVLIFNDSKLEEKDKGSYNEFREKVIDIEIEFSPTIEECVKVIFLNYQDPGSNEEKLYNHIRSLWIKNIRILQKIKRTFEVILPYLKGLNSWVLNQALSTICLFSLSYYWSHKKDDKSSKKDEATSKPSSISFQKNEDIKPVVPPPEYLYKLEYLWHLYDTKDADSVEAWWDTLLQIYGYWNSDDFDKELFRTIERWYVIEEDLMRYARDNHEKFEQWDVASLYKKAWTDYYHGWFSNNKYDFIKALKNAFKEWWELLNVWHLNSAVSIIRELNGNEIADELIDSYIQDHSWSREDFDVSKILREITSPLDAEIKRKFIDKYNELGEDRDLKWVLDYIITQNYSFWVEEESILFQAAEDDIYSVIKNADGWNWRNYILIFLKYRKVSNAPEEWRNLTDRTLSALKRISDESLINKLRMKSYWVTE